MQCTPTCSVVSTRKRWLLYSTSIVIQSALGSKSGMTSEAQGEVALWEFVVLQEGQVLVLLLVLSVVLLVFAMSGRF